MDYELLKRLEESGFPKEKTADFTNAEFTMDRIVYDLHMEVPTLSELIEACGDKFEQLTRRKDGTWSACNYYKSKQDIYEVGNSAEEAVSLLWLALNKK